MPRALLLVILLAACAAPPEVETVAPVTGLATPPLLPTTELAGLAPAAAPADPLAARTAALRARADTLRAQP